MHPDFLACEVEKRIRERTSRALDLVSRLAEHAEVNEETGRVVLQHSGAVEAWRELTWLRETLAEDTAALEELEAESERLSEEQSWRRANRRRGCHSC